MDLRYKTAALAAAFLLALNGCTAQPASADTGAASAAPAQGEGAVQGRWVESEAAGLAEGLYYLRAPAELDDGTLVLYGRDENTDPTEVTRFTSADDGATWQGEETSLAAQTGGSLIGWDVNGDGTAVLSTVQFPGDGTRHIQLWLESADGTLTELPLPEETEALYSTFDLYFLNNNTLAVSAVSRQAGELPGDVFFYDLESRSILSWVSAPQSAQGDVAVSSGTRGFASLLPAEEGGTPFLYCLTHEGDLCRADLDGSLTTVQAGFIGGGYVSAQIVTAADGALYYAESSGIYRRAPDGSLTEQIVEGSGSSLGLQDNFVSGMAATAGGSYLVLTHSTTGGACHLYRFSYDETLATTATLEVWSLEEDATVRAAMQSFAQAHPECEVIYTPALGGDTALTADDALRTLNTELLAGEGPDVLILDGSDLDAFAESGLLADLAGTVDTDALYGFISADYTRADGTIPLLPARFTVPLVHGTAGTLDGVQTLDDLAALVHAYAPRPGGQSWTPLAEDERYAFGFERLEDLVEFTLQTSQPAVLGPDGLDQEALRAVLRFIADVGGYYGMDAYPQIEYPSGTANNFGGTDTVSWGAGMSEYAQTQRAVFGYGSMTTPGWLGATGPDRKADGQTILQPGLCRGAYLPACFTAVSAASENRSLALEFAATIFSGPVQGRYQSAGLPATKAGGQAYLERNLAAMQENGYTGGFEELLAGLDTPVQPDEALLASINEHAAALLAGSETLDEAAAGVEADLSLRFAEGR